MSPIKRRQFLQFASSALATLGLSQLDIEQKSLRYARVLAQSTPRKLALLVGINTYSDQPLQGCVTDVSLQQQLLINRFGFNSKDILTVTDRQATRSNILTAFEEHLIKQAKPGDVVVFHFSGHGSRVKDPDKDTPDGLNSTFVPVDYSQTTENNAVQDIMGHTLFLLMKAVQTENLTVVLDSCHSGGAKRGNFRVRSRDGGSQLQAISDEKNYQQQWLSRLNLSLQDFIQQRRTGVAKGVVIASARRNQLAADAPFSDFYAGVFTYVMTQYLWQQSGNETVASIIPNVSRTTTQISVQEQKPEYEVKPGSDNDRRSVYFIDKQTPPAEAAIVKVEGDRVQIWLGGLNPQSLAAFGQGAILAIVDPQKRHQGQVKLQSRNGLVGVGKLMGTAQPGTLLQENVRGIPTDVTLHIGLDLSLGNDAAAAKQALQANKRIEIFPLQQAEVNYIFGRITNAYHQELQQRNVADIPAIGSLGLFSPGLDLIPGSFAKSDETVTDAVNRLQPKLKSLLAARIIKLTLNTNSSRLNAIASMSQEGQNQILASTFPVRSIASTAIALNRPQQGGGTPPLSSNSRELPLGTSIQFRIVNNESRNLYLSVLAIDSTGEMSILFPNNWTATDDVMQLNAGQTLLLPDPSKDNFTFVTQKPKGITEVLIIASTTPLRKALSALRSIASQGQQQRGPFTPSEPTEVIDRLLDDLDEGTRGNPTAVAVQNQGIKSIDTSQIAAMSITFEII
ncbi:caspase family protein [Argonema antarcticum]|uniref:caspase family protein n=1 Tax=Argonema antarcticum TaxID=2942763 RepID=UPI0020127542|nr:caspase family protein [Argonema antarcticum]MCL1475515.1 caspase family protein [Argonema antarcticum A004/B2]